MSDEQFFCAYCGYNSDNKERCTHCGREIDELYETSPPFSPPLVGRMTLRLSDPAGAEQTWKEIADIWWQKVEQFRSGRPSQLEQFHTSADTVELYGTDYMADMMREALGSRCTIDFQELTREQMPQRPPYKPPRPPTVPRNKR